MITVFDVLSMPSCPLVAVAERELPIGFETFQDVLGESAYHKLEMGTGGIQAVSPSMEI